MPIPDTHRLHRDSVIYKEHIATGLDSAPRGHTISGLFDVVVVNESGCENLGRLIGSERDLVEECLEKTQKLVHWQKRGQHCIT